MENLLLSLKFDQKAKISCSQIKLIYSKADVEQVVYYYLDYLIKQSDSPARRTDHN